MTCTRMIFKLACFLGLMVASCSSQAAGWKMTDRFTAFRFELFSNPLDITLEESIQSHADLESCFGWVQRTPNSVVGEVRCSKVRGLEFLQWLKQLKHVTNVESLIYPDAKIRLHFSHFKILDPTRETCFLDQPHRCSDIKKEKDYTRVNPTSSKNEF